jgi:hypothetical protein
MAECWLRSNRRVAAIGAIVPAVVGLVGVLLAAGWLGTGSSSVPRWIGAIVTGVGGVFLATWLYVAGGPRLAYEHGYLVVALRVHRVLRVPIELVECFFLGQGPSHLPGPAGAGAQTADVVVRLAERADEWKHRVVHPMLGRWCDGYITIRGAWCEPLSALVIQRMNWRLAEVKRDRKTGCHPDKDAT